MNREFCIFLLVAILFVLPSLAQDSDRTVEPPKLVAPLQPFYPEEARQAGLGGRVTVRVVVGESGEVLSVDQPAGPAQICNGTIGDPRQTALRNSVIDAVKIAKFTPAMKDGKPVKTTIWVSSTFDPMGEGGADPSMRNLTTPKKLLDKGVIAGMAKRLPKPAYPAKARGARAAGAVAVRIIVDETGSVFTAEAVSGHHLLREAAVEAACLASFSPTLVEGTPIRVRGVITYNFVP